MSTQWPGNSPAAISLNEGREVRDTTQHSQFLCYIYIQISEIHETECWLLAVIILNMELYKYNQM